MPIRSSILLIIISLMLATSASAFSPGESAGNVGLITFNSRADTGDELLLIRMDYNGDYEQFRKDMYAAATPNTVQNLQATATKGIDSLCVSANYFGVVVEPVEGQNFVIDLNGVNNPEQVLVDTKTTANCFTVEVRGTRSESTLISTVSDNRINTVRIGVPADALKQLELRDEGDSCMLVYGLDIPVQAVVGSGTARVQGEHLSSSVSMECSSGDVILKAKEVGGPVSLKTTSGDAVLLADRVTGKTELTATSGDITVEAGTVHDAVLQASSGDINAKVAEITGNVEANVSNGDLLFSLTREPVHLRFVFDGNAASENVLLPKGWTNGYKVGNGSPVLHLVVGRNGDLELKVGS